MAKINISIDDNLLQRMDEYCARTYQSRSGLIAQSLSQVLLTDDLRRSIIEMSQAMKLIAKNGEISEQDKKTLEDFEKISQLFTETLR